MRIPARGEQLPSEPSAAGQSAARQGRAALADGEEKTLVIKAAYEAFVFALVLLSLVNWFLIFLLDSPEQQMVVKIVQAGIFLFLLIDAVQRLARAPSKRRFFFHNFGWLYFLGSLPVPFLSAVRFVPTVILVRRLRRQDYNAIGQVVIERRAQSTLLVVILIAVLVLEISSILVLGAEAKGSEPNIRTASDALWWGIVTIATVGYGDRYPTTNQGRVIGIFVIIVGVALFTSLTSFLAQWFLRRRAAPGESGQDESGRQGQGHPLPNVTWEEVRAWLDQRESAQMREIEELRARLAVFESQQERQDATKRDDEE